MEDFQPPMEDRLGNPIIEKVRDLMRVNALQPAQRTPGWFKARQDRITASAAASILELTSFEIHMRDTGMIDLDQKKKAGQVMPAFNSRSKLLRMKTGQDNAPFTGNQYTEWGVTYEPIITALYEIFNDCVVHEFGMIPHPKIAWLGASPDGITSDGRMLEIKCPFRRIPKGMPKLQYWVQMQIQMECCGLPKCDYVDVVVREYDGIEGYLRDCYIDDETGESIFSSTTAGRPKGFLIEKTTYGAAADGGDKYEYFYPPVMQFTSHEEEQAWIADWSEREFGDAKPADILDVILHHRVGYRFRYWYIEDWQVKTIDRDEEWMQARIPELEEFWDEVEEIRRNPHLKRSHEAVSAPALLESATKKRRMTTPSECLFIVDGEDF